MPRGVYYRKPGTHKTKRPPRYVCETLAWDQHLCDMMAQWARKHPNNANRNTDVAAEGP